MKPRRLGPQQRELVRTASASSSRPCSHPCGECLVATARSGGEGIEAAMPDAGEVDAARQLVDRDEVPSEESRESPPHQAQPGLDLKGAVLALAEAEAEPSVEISVRFDVRDAEPISADRHPLLDPVDVQGPLRPRQTLAQQPQEETGPVHRGDAIGAGAAGEAGNAARGGLRSSRSAPARSGCCQRFLRPGCLRRAGSWRHRWRQLV